MADLLSRLAERTLEVAPVAQPITTSLFAKRQTMPGPPPESERFPEQDETPGASEPVNRRPSPRTTPRPPRAAPAGNPPYQPPASSAQLPPVPENQVSPQPEPPQSGEVERPPAHSGSHLLVGPDKVRQEERHYEGTRQDTSTNKPGDPGANIVSKREPRITDQPADNVEKMGQSTSQTPPVVQQASAGRMQQVGTPRASKPLLGSHQGLSSPGNDPAGYTVLPDMTSVLDVEIGQRAWPGERPHGDTVSDSPERRSERHRLPGSDGAPQRSTGARQRGSLTPGRQGLLVPLVQQQAEFSVRQQVESLFPDEFSGSPAVRSLPPPDSPPRNQGEAPSRRSPASITEGTSTAPTIRVTIGRIDVRAVTPPEPAPRPKPVRAGPTLSLDEYSRQRKGGGR